MKTSRPILRPLLAAVLFLAAVFPARAANWVTLRLLAPPAMVGESVTITGSLNPGVPQSLGWLATNPNGQPASIVGGDFGPVDLDDPALQSFHAEVAWGSRIATVSYSDNMEYPYATASNGDVYVWLAFQAPAGETSSQTRFLLPANRDGHAFALAQANADGGVYNSFVDNLGHVVGGSGGGAFDFLRLGAAYDPAKPFWLLDLTTRERGPASATDLASAGFTPDYTLYPLVSVTVYFEGQEAGHRFTMHSQAQGGPEMQTSLVAATVPGGWTYLMGSSTEILDDSAAVTAAVGEGLDVWLHAARPRCLRSPFHGGLLC